MVNSSVQSRKSNYFLGIFESNLVCKSCAIGAPFRNSITHLILFFPLEFRNKQKQKTKTLVSSQWAQLLIKTEKLNEFILSTLVNINSWKV